MLVRRAVGHMLRVIESYLLRRCDLLVVSSPAYARAYFSRVHAALPPVRVVENRILASELAMPIGNLPVSAPPWRIGWFGIIRCRRSLDILARLVRQMPDRIQVVIRGRPARDAIPEFDAVVAATPGLTFLGPYDRVTDLARIYADVHYVWAIDFYEAGANSAWLLPNRLYEGGIYGAVPIALRALETGRWLVDHQAGICLDEPLDETLTAFVAGLDAERDGKARAAMQRIPPDAFVCD
jgi:succinoglycan biosynthesis protein ExoL